jgi:hypothetical protein
VKRAMRTLTLAAAMGSAALAAALPATSGAATSAHAAQNGAAATVDPVIQWNRFVLNLQATPAISPPRFTRPTSSRCCTPRSTMRSSPSTTAGCAI